MIKVSNIQTKTITGTSADALDGNIRAFVQALNEEQFVSIHIYVIPGLWSATIVYLA